MGDEVQGWDDVLELDVDEAVYTLLPNGRYPFTVSKFERERAKDGAPMAKVYLSVDGGELGKTTVIENIKLVKSTDWKKSQLFASIGSPVNEQGKTIVDWNALEAGVACRTAFGVADIEVNRYKKDGEDRENNKVKQFLPYGTEATGPSKVGNQEPAPMPAQPQQAARAF